MTRSAGSLTGPAAPHVWIVENPSLIAKALDHFGQHCPPLVCTSGWPNTAVVELLRRLRSSGAELWCHADLDGDGLRIAAYVAAKTGARPWRMTTSDYLTAILEAAAPEAVIPEADGTEAGPAPGRLTDVSWDPTLPPPCEFTAWPSLRSASPTSSSTTWRGHASRRCTGLLMRPSPGRNGPAGGGG